MRSCYSAPLDWTLGDGNQIFVNGVMMTEVCWPNNTGVNAIDLSGRSYITFERVNVFSTGLYGDDTDSKYEKFLSDLEKAGLSKIIADKQAQVDAFIASKG